MGLAPVFNTAVNTGQAMWSISRAATFTSLNIPLYPFQARLCIQVGRFSFLTMFLEQPTFCYFYPTCTFNMHNSYTRPLAFHSQEGQIYYLTTQETSLVCDIMKNLWFLLTFPALCQNLNLVLWEPGEDTLATQVHLPQGNHMDQTGSPNSSELHPHLYKLCSASLSIQNRQNQCMLML